MAKFKEYKIRKISDIDKIVTPENVDIFCDNMVLAIREAVKEKSVNPPYRWYGFRWVDDGKTEYLGYTLKTK